MYGMDSTKSHKTECGVMTDSYCDVMDSLVTFHYFCGTENGFGFLYCHWMDAIPLFYHVIIQIQDPHRKQKQIPTIPRNIILESLYRMIPRSHCK